MKWMINVIKSSAVPMVPPPAYGAFHLTFFLVGLCFAAAVAYWLRHTDERRHRAVLLGVGSLLLSFEIYKQVFQAVAIGYEHYPFGIFPFHLCSTPMYLCFVAAALPEGKLRRAVSCYMATYGFLGGFTSFFEPSGLSHGYWVQTLHSYTWHILLVFLGLYLLGSGRVGVEKADFKRTALFFCGMCAAAFCINLIFWNASNGTINMFFVGPGNSTIIVFRWISERFGWYVSTPLFMASLTFGAWVLFRIGRRVALRGQAPATETESRGLVAVR